MFDHQLGAQLVEFCASWPGYTQKLVAVLVPMVALDRVFSRASL
jgi:hypothetical protein